MKTPSAGASILQASTFKPKSSAVEHVKQWGLDADTKSAIEAQFDYPFMQLPEKLMPLAKDAVAVVLRSEGDPTAVIGSVRRAVEEIDPR